MPSASRARTAARTAAHMNGRCPATALPAALETTDMMKGDRNCAIYMAADSSGITVETASLPALCDVAAIMHGIPAPFAKPTMNEPATDIAAPDAAAMIRYPAQKSAGAAKCALEPSAPRIFT